MPAETPKFDDYDLLDENVHDTMDEVQAEDIPSQSINLMKSYQGQSTMSAGPSYSLLSTAGAHNNQNDSYLGTLNTFVDTKVATLHVLI